jgi:hypothetical protein
MRFVKEFFKFQGMRKEQDFIIYPCLPTDSIVWLQSDNRMMKINLETREAMLSKPTRNNGFLAVEEFFGAKKLTLTLAELDRINKMKEAMSGRTNSDRTFNLIG